MAGPNNDFTLALKERQHAFLKEMADKYNLPDQSKAVRCLIDFALVNPDSEGAIFKTIHCTGC